jgi:hypothetical protein
MLVDWLIPTLVMLPVLLAVLLGAGVPWALVILPRADWRDRPLVVALALALGAMILTTVMFLLGTFAQMTVAGTLTGVGLVTLAGGIAAYRRTVRTTPVPAEPRGPIARWAWLILGGLIAALVLRFLQVAYWPFTAYDALWVYGYNARVFTLTGQIPASMDYYPQLIPLTYTFGQLVWGGINDHAARAILPIFALGSVLAAYLVGARWADHRTGLLTAALWTFYPAHAQWSRSGDLEVPLAFFFTMAALFFLLAWRGEGRDRWRYAVASGLMLGGGMWTKPTAGAFVWGVGMVFLVAVIRRWRDWPYLWDRFRLIVVVGIACAPIGGMWYIRNLLYGHAAVVFPPAYWLTQAQRSGRQLEWPLIGLVLLAALWLLGRADRPDRRLLLGGLLLMLGGALPSAGLFNTATHRLTLLELAALLIGAGLYAVAVIQWGRRRRAAGESLPPEVPLVRDVIALVVPYWITWFWSYSYHPRLAFAIVPLQFFILALLIARLVDRLPDRVNRPVLLRRAAFVILIAFIGVGLWAVVDETVPYWLTGELVDDNDKHLASNYALTRTVNLLRADFEAEDIVNPDDVDDPPRPINIVAPGNLRLPFFFPELPINTDPVTDLAVLDDGVTHFIDGFEADLVYDAIGQPVNQARGAMGRDRLVEPLGHEYDGDFYYTSYRINTALRWQEPSFNGFLPEPVQIGDLAAVSGFSTVGREYWPGRRVVVNTILRVTGTTDMDYQVFMHVMDGDQQVATWDHTPGGDSYPTSLWEPGEYIEDRIWAELDETVPLGTFQVNMGLYDLATGDRLPVQVGDTTTDSFTVLDVIINLAEPPDWAQ